MTFPRLLSTTILLSLALSLEACGDDTPEGCAIEPNFTSIHANRLSTGSCAIGSCHGSARSGGMDFSLSKNEVYAQLVGVPSEGGGTRLRVATSSRAESYLYVKVSDDNAPEGRMPPLGAPLAQCEIDAIGDWIDMGAAND